MKAEIKNTIFARVTAMLLVAYQLVFSVACSDMLDTDSTRDLFDKELNQKTDSMFMAYGIMQAMQQLADQYVLTGEMRGDLTATTYYTNGNLRQLADFSATAANRYDSAYVYYAVVNNCNYYVAHRDTALYTGSTNVVINEYAAVKAFRACSLLAACAHLWRGAVLHKAAHENQRNQQREPPDAHSRRDCGRVGAGSGTVQRTACAGLWRNNLRFHQLGHG